MKTVLLSLALSASAWNQAAPPAQQDGVSAEHAARLYRIQIYETYRLDRAEYNRRREAGEEVWQGWKQAQGNPEAREAAIRWYQAAREASRQAAGQLPPLPGFDDALPMLQVATSAQEDKILLDAAPLDAVEKLNVELPASAVQTGPTRVFSTLVRTTFRALGASFDAEPTEEKAADIDELPSDLPLEPAAIEPPPPPPPAPKADKAKRTRPVKQAVPAMDTSAIDNLFEPATAPAEPAIDADPFAP